MKCSLSKSAAACMIFAVGYSSIVKADVIATGVAIYEFYDHFISEGRKWQDKQGWGKFRSWKRGSPVIIGNITNQVVPFNFEDKDQGCAETQVKLPAMSSQAWRCDDGNSATEYTIIWKGTHYAAQAQHYYLFEPDKNGQPSLVEVTEGDLQTRLDTALANVRREEARRKAAAALSKKCALLLDLEGSGCLWNKKTCECLGWDENNYATWMKNLADWRAKHPRN